MPTLKQWCQEQFSSLGCDVSEDLINYMINMDNSKDIKGYLTEMLNIANPIHQEFIEQFILKWKYGTEENLVAYKKPGKVLEQSGSTKSTKKRGKDIQPETTYFEPNKKQQNEDNDSSINVKSPMPGSSSKRKNKFTSLHSGTARDILTFPGRQVCVCQASKHSLINNCLQCGRIVCQQEGSGPCFTCGNLVCTIEEQKIITSHSKQSEKLLSRLCVKDDVKLVCVESAEERSSLEKAIEHKNKLLEYDKTVERRTHVIDDESDYFSADALKWMSPAEQKKLKEKEEEMSARKHSSRRNKKFTLDFAGRCITEEYDEPDFDLNFDHFNSISNNRLWAQDSANINPNISIKAPQYEGEENDRPKIVSSAWEEEHTLLHRMKIQDSELQLMSDGGMCLSVHQPWASFLISGIKQHEGRTWYTPHRGRLWIHGGGKVPTSQEIAEAENSVKIISGNEYMKFPEQYPTGCLLGCVDVVDCLPQEEYRLQYPDGESCSPYVIICINPQELVIKFPMKGNIKIFKMDPKLHQAAKKTLRKIHDL